MAQHAPKSAGTDSLVWPCKCGQASFGTEELLLDHTQRFHSAHVDTVANVDVGEKAPRYCSFEKVQKARRAMLRANSPAGAQHLAVLNAVRWKAGKTITVSFLDVVPRSLKERILSHMNAWRRYCNILFKLVEGIGEVRISLGPKPGDQWETGYWSYLGTDILSIPLDRPTMNLQDFSDDTPESEFIRVVRHETGHTLGFPHEHMREEIVNRIDRAKAIRYFGAPPNSWTPDEVDQQVLTPLDPATLTETINADENSIMCYQLAGSIMKDGKAVRGGIDIDASDAKFAARVYPFPSVRAVVTDGGFEEQVIAKLDQLEAHISSLEKRLAQGEPKQ